MQYFKIMENKLEDANPMETKNNSIRKHTVPRLMIYVYFHTISFQLLMRTLCKVWMKT